MSTMISKPPKPIIHNYPDEKAAGYTFYSNILPEQIERYEAAAQRYNWDLKFMNQAYNIFGDEVRGRVAVLVRGLDAQEIFAVLGGH